MLKVSSSISTNTGFPLCFATHEVDAKKVNGDVIISFSSLNPNISDAITKASVPEATPIAFFTFAKS